MVNVSLAFAVIALGGSAADIGLVFAARAAALSAFLLLGGPIADRFPRRRVLIGADLVRLASQATLAATLLMGDAGVAAVAALSAVTGAGTGIYNPASTGFLPAVVGPANLQRANALRGLASSLARIGGPLAAGVLVATLGAGWGLAIDAASFAISALLLASIHPPRQPAQVSQSFLSDLRHGWTAVRERRWLWTFSAWAALGNLLFGCWTVVGPVISQHDLGGAAVWGSIIAVSGLGGIVGGVFGLRIQPKRPVLFSVVGVSLLFLPMPLLALRLVAPVIALGATIGEIGLVLGATVWESTLQRHIEPPILSRAASFSWFGSTALQPAGLALWGPVAVLLGTTTALWVAFGLLLASVVAVLTVNEIWTLPAHPTDATASHG
jgi:MFS family permease